VRRFAFRLDRVARVREVERDRAQAQWAVARRRRDEVAARLDGLREAARAEAVGLVPGRPADLRAVAFRATLRAQAVELGAAELQTATAAAEDAGAALRSAAQRVEALDRLRDAQRESWQVAARRDEAAVLDDVATTRAARAGGRG
jgi:flagellar export protein FliJ